MNSKDNRRIAKNSIILYFRVFFLMLITLYSSRLILKVLGEVDYGIYNVVGGVVVFFSFLNTSMATATQRFLTIELAKKDVLQLNKVFSMSINIHAIIFIIIFFLSEIIGVWFLNNRMNIPIERMEAANWIFQFSLISLGMTILTVPYSAIIISYERMNIYALITSLDVLLKFSILFTLPFLDYDNLKVYSFLIFIISIIVFLFYRYQCRKKLIGAKYKLIWDKNLFLSLSSFAGWSLFGNFAAITMNQGLNILLNIFFGPIVNAARGISFQVKSAVDNIVNSSQLAISPQITKNFSNGNHSGMLDLVFKGVKFSFFITLLFSLPLIFNMDKVILLWLGKTPNDTVIFCKLVIINSLIDCVSGPLRVLAQSTGNIKKYQLYVGGVLLLNLPISYLLLLNGNFKPEIVFYISIGMSIIAFVTRLLVLKKIIDFPIIIFIKEIVFSLVLITIISVILIVFISSYISNEILTIPLSILVMLLLIYVLGINDNEKKKIKQKIFK